MTGPDLASQLLADRPVGEDPVVCHGDLSIPNVLFDPDTVEFTGFIDVGRVGTADRHADIGIVTRSLSSDLNPQYHPGGAARFLRRYQQLAPAAVDRAGQDRLLPPARRVLLDRLSHAGAAHRPTGAPPGAAGPHPGRPAGPR